MDTPYIPQPIDTSQIVLPDSLMNIAEQLGKQIHETWAQQRIAEGWKYGEERNDKRKEHPCLIPYEDLPENEKEYDRNTAFETIRFLLGKGYQITYK
ncbi:MAG TPA: Ryanodine receptor Ryr [Porphyromonadaceae bacterium]|nr:Ryanodine receptor Ryr [Porphyromonadaceae bacterium]